MSIAILATGDEIIYGDTLNTNTHAIAHVLSTEGFSLGLHLSCCDKEDALIHAIQFLSQDHDIIITLGGLGPTSDDRTRFALAGFLKIPLVESPEALAHIETRLKRAHLTLNPGNRQQALFPSDAVTLPNPNGTAMGCYYRWQNKLFIMLPGPPRECLPMFNDYVLPLLQQTILKHDQSLYKWRLFGVAEGEIAEILDNALSSVACETGYRLDMPYLEFKVRCHESEAHLVRQLIEPLVTSHIIAPPEEKASERLCSVIDQLDVSMVILDDVTGGILQTLIQKPSNYHKLIFHNKNNTAELYFHLSGLQEYWSQQEDKITTSITIKYHNDIEHGSETHQIPYRGPHVVYYAAEWLSFRLLHLIDQLHQ